MTGLSAEDLSRRAGTTPAQVGHFVELGILETVNLASRIADYARPREVLVSADVAEQAQDAAAYATIGENTLRGVLDPISLFRAQIRHTLPAE